MADPNQAITLNVEELLTIDVDAELRKLAVAQFQGTWQLPCEFVRRGLQAQASRVDVQIARGRFEVIDDGAPVSREMLEHLAALLNTQEPSSRRHEALIALELADAPALLAVAGLGSSRIEFISGPHALRVDASGNVTFGAASRTGNTTSIKVQGLKIEVNQARRWLASKCRFASDRVVLQGQTIEAGDRAFLASRGLKFQDPRWQTHDAINAHALTGQIGLPASGDTTRVVILRHGVVSTHVSVQHAPYYEAVIDVGPALDRPMTGEGLRAAVRGWLEPLTDQAIDLLHRVGSEIETAGPRVQARLTTLILHAARRRSALEKLVDLPFIACVEPDASSPSRVSLAALLAQARPPGNAPTAMLALFPGQNPLDYTLAGNRVYLIDAATRGALSELLSIRFRTPAPRSDRRSLASRVRAVVKRILATGTWLRRSRTPIPASELSRAENNFLSGLQAIAAGAGPRCPSEISMCAGKGAPTRSGAAPGELWLPRNNPDVRACIDAHAQNGDAWLYVAALALLGGQGMPSASARATWLRGWQPATDEPPTSG
ncbi:MAG: hypothetical protein ACPG4T_00715 [Nannocystaceae bacterium]